MSKAISRLLRALLVCSVLAGSLSSARPAAAAPGGRHAVDVLVREPASLQLLAFWVALGGGYFAREGLDVHVISAPAPSLLQSMFKAGAAPVAVLPGPDYERLIADRFPFVLAANLLQNDPLVLVIHHDTALRLHLSIHMPLRARLDALRSMAIGVAVPDRARLYALFHSQGLDANIARIVTLKGEEQLAAFANDEVDVLYAATPYAEGAIVDKDADVLMTGGDVPAFSERMIQALAVARPFADAHPGDVHGLVRALAAAEHAVRFEPSVAEAAIRHALPAIDAKHVARAVSLYEPAVPGTPHVEAKLIAREALFYPVGGDHLDLGGIDLADYVLPGADSAPRGPGERRSGGASPRLALGLLAALALMIALFFAFGDQGAGRDGQGGSGVSP